jgi:hypothetical protein|tara:strand:+ start:4666 stop:5031 length:366 start_codon:yes stop_codon:yes gene_type:complete
MTEEKKEIWSMDELVALTDEVQISEVVFREKVVEFQFCELVEKEEPKIKSQDRMTEDEKMGYFQELGSERVFKMITKANEKNPDGPCISEEQWKLLPTTLRYQITNKILGVESEVKENFTL